MCGLHRHQQGLPERLLLLTDKRSENRIPCLILVKMLPRGLKGTPSDTNGQRGQEKNNVLYKRSSVLLQKAAFRFKNAGATYQRLVDTVFSNQIGRNLKVHVDDMVIKSDSEEDMLADIQETFDKLRAINMKLNPRKCSFGMEEGPFLGYLIKPPKTVKEIQSLNEKLAALSRFLPKRTDKTLPFLKVLKNCANKKIVQ
ncbi:reverse transcriptase domain-containing protein [Tanacetum coccineum]